MESLEREQKQIDCQADELEVELRKVMNTGKLKKYVLFDLSNKIYQILVLINFILNRK